MNDPRDLLEQISARFDALQAEVERTRVELAAAKARIASYETFETNLSDAIAAAVARAQEELLPRLTSLRDDLARAEQQRDALVGEIEHLRSERGELEAGIAALRPTSSQLHSASAETLRAVFKQAMGEIRAELQAIAAAPAREAARRAEPARPEERFTPLPAEERGAPRESIAEQRVLPVPSDGEESHVEETDGAPVSRVERSDPADPAPAYEGFIEDVDERNPSPATRRVALADALAEDQRQIELVLQGVRSFPQLIALENRIQSFPGVSRVYMHRAGVDGSATLTVQLEPDLDRDGFVARLEQNDRPQLAIEGVRGTQVAARIES